MISSSGENLGIKTPAEGIEMARAVGMDLVLFSPTAQPPVARLASLQALRRAQKDAVKSKRISERQAKLKEIKASARIDGAREQGAPEVMRSDLAREWERGRVPCPHHRSPTHSAQALSTPTHPPHPYADHDLEFKSRRVLDFLREKHTVRLVVTLNLHAWSAEEPARRLVFARILRAVRRVRWRLRACPPAACVRACWQ